MLSNKTINIDNTSCSKYGRVKDNITPKIVQIETNIAAKIGQLNSRF